MVHILWVEARSVPRVRASVVVLILLLSGPASMAVGEGDEPTSCTVMVDWGVEEHWDGGWNLTYDVLHRYLIVFDPAFTNGSSPSALSVEVEHHRDGEQIADATNTSVLSAGGEVDIVLSTEPMFGDSVSISVVTAEASCSRDLSITNWNQPVADHEITRETTWSMEGAEEGNGIEFEGRGWQQRTGSTLESNELGNGTLSLDSMNGTEGMLLELNLDRIWLNETYDGVELLRQDFEMSGNGSLFLNSTEQEEGGESDGFSVDVQVNDVYVLRSWDEGELTERFLIDGTGWLSFNGCLLYTSPSPRD